MRLLLPLTLTAVLAAAGQAAHAQPAPRTDPPVVAKKPAKAAAPAAAQAYWYDGKLRRALTIDPERVADFGPGDVAAPRGQPQLKKASATKAKDAKISPLFRGVGAPASDVRALPGGIIVTLREAGTAEAANEALAPFGLRVARQVDSTGLRWVVATAPGMIALETAIRLHESGAFASVTPDWWIGVTKK